MKDLAIYILISTTIWIYLFENILLHLKLVRQSIKETKKVKEDKKTMTPIFFVTLATLSVCQLISSSYLFLQIKAIAMCNIGFYDHQSTTDLTISSLVFMLHLILGIWFYLSASSKLTIQFNQSQSIDKTFYLHSYKALQLKLGASAFMFALVIASMCKMCYWQYFIQ